MRFRNIFSLGKKVDGAGAPSSNLYQKDRNPWIRERISEKCRKGRSFFFLTKKFALPETNCKKHLKIAFAKKTARFFQVDLLITQMEVTFSPLKRSLKIPKRVTGKNLEQAFSFRAKLFSLFSGAEKNDRLRASGIRSL